MKKILIILLASYAIPHFTMASVIVQNGLTHVHDLSGSGKTEGHLFLKNTGNSEERVKVYFNDLSIECDGKISYLESGSTPNSLFPYLIVDNQDIILKGKEEYEIIYQIDISNVNIQAGSLWTLMMLEVAEPISMDKSNQGFEIGSKIRYAVQIIGNIGNASGEGMEFTDIKLNKDQTENRVIDVSLANSGLYMVSPKMEIQLFDENGSSVKNLTIRPRKVYPKNCQKFQIELNDLPKGKYKAILFAEYLEEAVGVNLQIEI